MRRRHKTPPRVIGITGHMRTGKDTSALVLCKEFGYRRIAFADPLKAIARRIGWDQTKFSPSDYAAMHGLFNLEDPNGNPELVFKPGAHNGRLLLQELGTACRDQLGAGVWVRALVSSVKANPFQRYVVSDVRFHNEATAIRDLLGGEVWRIVRPGFDGDSHASERDVPHIKVDLEIVNDGTVEDLVQKIREAMHG